MGLLHLLDHEAQNPQLAHFNKTPRNPSFNLWKLQLPFRTKQQQQQNQAKHPPKKKRQTQQAKLKYLQKSITFNTEKQKPKSLITQKPHSINQTHLDLQIKLSPLRL